MTNDVYGVSVGYPRSWEIDELLTPGLLAQIRASDNEDTPFVRLFVFYSATETSPAEIADEVVGSLAQESGFRALSERNVTLPGDQAGFQVSYATGVGAREARGSFVAVARGTQSFVVLVRAQRAAYEADRDMFQQVLESLTLQEPRPFGYSREDILVLHADDGPLHLDPAHANTSREVRYITQVFDGLVSINADLEVEPNLARSWDITGNGTVYRFHIDPDARFHSGRQVTAQDVKDSWERVADPETGSQTAEMYLDDIVGLSARLAGEAQEVSGVRVVDEMTLEVTIDAPKAYFLSKLSHPVAYVVDRENLAEDTEETPWWFHPVGTGPFKMSVWEPGMAILLERHDAYHRGQALLPAVVFRFYGGIRTAMYEAGEIDVAPVGGQQVEEVSRPGNPLSADLRIIPELGVYYLGFDTTEPPFDDPRVRRAFLLATDRQRLIDEIIGPSGEVAHGFLPPGMPGYDPDIAAIPYDPNEAHRLLEQTAYGSAEGLPTILYTPAGDGPITQLLLSMWRDNLGASMQSALIPDRFYFELLDTLKGNLYDYGWIADYPDPQNFLDVLFHSRSASNVGRYSNAQVDSLLEQARTEQDHEERLRLYQQVERLLVEDAAAIPLYFSRSHVLVAPYVRGYEPSPQGLVELRLVSLER